MSEISIQFYNDHEIRAILYDKNSGWQFSMIDIIAASQRVTIQERIG